jgi:hypothetical protein
MASFEDDLESLEEKWAREDKESGKGVPLKPRDPAKLVSPEEAVKSYLKPEVGALRGKQLRFSADMQKYLAGPANTCWDVPTGTRLVVDMSSHVVGWVCWLNGEKIDDDVGRPMDGFVPRAKNMLGGPDPKHWEKWKDGRPKSPWQQHETAVMTNLENEELFTYTMRSFDERAAMKAFVAKYLAGKSHHPNEWPIVELQVAGKLPVFDLVGWALRDDEPELPAREPPPPPPPGDPGPSSPDAYGSDDPPF